VSVRARRSERPAAARGDGVAQTGLESDAGDTAAFDDWDASTARALVAELYTRHATGDTYASHLAAVAREKASIRARAAYKHERHAIWTLLHATNPPYRRFVDLTARGRPLVVRERVTACEPATASSSSARISS
jgi:hypothetical protein